MFAALALITLTGVVIFILFTALSHLLLHRVARGASRRVLSRRWRGRRQFRRVAGRALKNAAVPACLLAAAVASRDRPEDLVGSI
jgi:hypothetical protein